MYCTELLWLAAWFSLAINWCKSVAWKLQFEANVYLVSCYWNSNAANFLKRKSILTENSKFSCISNAKITQSGQTITAEFISFTPKVLRLLDSPINCSHFEMILSKMLISLRKSRLNFWHKNKKHFAHIEIFWIHIIPKNFCSFLTFNYTMNKILKYFLILI